MKTQANCLMRGFFTLKAHQEDDGGNVIPGTERDIAEFENLITDNGMELLKGNGFLDYVMVGSGSTPPTAADTTLGAFVAGIGNADVSEGPHDFTPADYPWCSASVSVQFGKGDAAGNLSEIGIGKSQTNMFSRALIKDGSGNPTTITVLPIELLTVTYQWRVYFDLTYSSVDSFVIDSVTYTATSTVSGLGETAAYIWEKEGLTVESRLRLYTEDTNPPGQLPSGSVIGGLVTATSVSDAPLGVYYEDFSWTIATSEGNPTPPDTIGAFDIYNSSNYPVSLKTAMSPGLPKDKTKTMDLTMRFAWGRYQ